MGAFVDAATGCQIARALRKALRGKPPPERQVLVSDGPVDSPMPQRPSPARRQRIPASWGLGTYDDPVRPVYDERTDTFYGITRRTLSSGAAPRELVATPEGAARWRLAQEAMRQYEEDGRMDALLARGKREMTR